MSAADRHPSMPPLLERGTGHAVVNEALAAAAAGGAAASSLPQSSASEGKAIHRSTKE